MQFTESKPLGIKFPALSNHGAVADMEGRILVFGGSLGNSKTNSQVYMFDTLAERWTTPLIGVNQGSAFPEGR